MQYYNLSMRLYIYIYILFICLDLFIYYGSVCILSPMELFYMYFVVYYHVHVFVVDWHSLQVGASVVLFTMSNFK